MLKFYAKIRNFISQAFTKRNIILSDTIYLFDKVKTLKTT